MPPIQVIELDHRLALVRVALGASLDTRLATDTAAGVDEELEALGNWHIDLPR
jgi:hypothetical protein